MRSSILYATTLVVAAIAAPQRRRDLAERAIVWDIKTVTDTIYVTEGYEPTSTHHAAPIVKTTPPPPPPPAPTTTYAPKKSVAPQVAAPKPTPVVITYAPPPPKKTTPVYVPPAPTPKPAPAPAAAPASGGDGSPLSGGVSILSTCNKFRSLYGLQPFKWSSKLAGNAQQTGELNGGHTENHHLFDGSFAQVITPGLNSDPPGVNLGGFTPFEMGYLSWMCEKSSDSQINQMCPVMQSAMNMYYSDTGHYDILTSTSYLWIGCAFVADPNASSTTPYQGLWTCDLSFETAEP